MNNEIEHVQTNSQPNGNGLDVQNVAMLGAMIAGTGLESLEVQGLLAEVHRTSLSASVNSMAAILDKITRVQQARMINMINRITNLPSMAGHVNKAQVLQIITSVMSSPPKQ